MAGPLGPERQDLLFARLMKLTADLNRAKGKPEYELKLFVPQWDAQAPQQRREQQSPEDMLRAIKGANKRLGGGQGVNAG